MQSGSPVNLTPASPVNRVASPRPPLHPKTQISNLDSPRARNSPVASQVSRSPSPGASGSTGARTARLRSPKSQATPDSARINRAQTMPVTRTRSSVFDQSKIIPRIDISSGKRSVGSGLFWILMKSILAAVFLFGAVTIAALSQTNLSMNWLAVDGTYPMSTCPSYDFIVGFNQNVDGPWCKVYMAFASASGVIHDSHMSVFVSNGNLFGVGMYPYSCNDVGSILPQCSLVSWDDEYPATVSGTPCRYNVAPYCDGSGDVSVGQIINIRGVFFGSGLIVFIYGLVSSLIVIRVVSTLIPNRQRRLDSARNFADTAAKEMTKMVDDEWSTIEFDQSLTTRSTSRSGSLRSTPVRSSSLKVLPSLIAESGNFGKVIMGPRDLFASDSWKLKVGKSLGEEAQTRRRVSTAQMKIQYGLIIFVLYFAITIGLMEIVLYALPTVYSKTTVRSVFSVLFFQAELTSSIWTAGTTWLDFTVIADTLISLILLVSSSLCFVQWPLLQVKVPMVVKIRTGIRRGQETDFRQAADDGAIYAETICAVVVCRESCSSESRRQGMVKRLQNLLTMFPPDSVFVVDSHPHSVVPVDPTWQLAHSVSPSIRYCFVPDCESKSFALHWFNSVWLPFLARTNQSQAFTHFLVIGAADNEGALPQIPLDISIPRENLAVNMDNLRAIHMPIGAATTNASSSSLTSFHDLEMKARAVLRLGESKLGSCLEVEQVASIWERDALYTSMGQSGVSSEWNSPNGQLKNGLAVVKMRTRNHIGTMPHSFVGVSVPNTYSEMITSRVLSGSGAGEAGRIGIAIRELFSVFSICNVYSWSVKPTLFLTTLVGGFLQMIRPFVIGTLVFRDIFAIIALAVCAVILIYTHEFVLMLVFASRPDLRAKWTLAPLVFYPMYRCIITWVVEIAGLFDFILGGSVRNLTLRPEKRAKDLNDVPACPPFYLVNWFTVWRTGHNDEELSNFDDIASIGRL